MVEVFHSASWPDGDPVDLVVKAVKEETQELLSILLATKHTVMNRNASDGLKFSDPKKTRETLKLKGKRITKLTCIPQIWEHISGSEF